MSWEKLSQPFWALSPEEVINLLTSSSRGLRWEEIEERLSVFGRNLLPKSKKAAKLEIFLNQFRSPLILVLLAALVITLLISDYKDAVFIFAAVAVNTALGFYQENKAETALQSLASYLKERVRVIREDKELEIDAEEVVPGDILKLLQGSRVAADARIIYANNLSVDESVLTGESLPVNKSVEAVEVEAGIADRRSMVFAGTLVTEGLGLAVVTATGAATEIGKIASLVKEERELTPLQVAIAQFARTALIVLGLLVILLFVLGIAGGYPLLTMFIISVAVAVAAVPEGLPIALTVILAVGVERLAKRKGIVRKLLAAETLGSTTVILTDKTGTLTEAKMELSQIITVGRVTKEEVLELAVLNTDVVLENENDNWEDWRIVGRPLEVSLVRAAAKHQVLLRKAGDKFKILDRHPFNSVAKIAAVELSSQGKKFWAYLGAPEKLIEKTNLSESERERLLVALDDLAYAGYRVLGVARDHTFLGLLAFNDPVRPSVKDAVREAARAGIRTVIITGDHKGTAEAVAKEIGLEVSSDEVLTGSDLQSLDDQTLSARLAEVKVFARVAPADKLRLVKLYQSRGEVVAVTGDGVNDAPALKQADIGVAVGSGTDVAKGASDLVILDDNFETIVAAVEEGRKILANIKKVIVYLLSNSLDGLLLIGGSFLTGLPLPLGALQILFVNFLTDSFPAIAFAFESGENHLGEKPPRLKERLFDREVRILILVVGLLTSLILFALYFVLWSLGYPQPLVRSFIFATFALYTLFLAFSVRSLKKSIFSYHPFANRYLTAGAAIGFLLTLAVIYLPPFQAVFEVVALPLPWLLGVIAFGLLNISAVEAVKFFFRKKEARREDL